MTTKEVIALARENGLRASIETVRRWRQGFYKLNGKQVWYFKDHFRLPHGVLKDWSGYTYSRPAVIAWLKAVKATREEI